MTFNFRKNILPISVLLSFCIPLSLWSQTKEELYDKVLGVLVGSAIGDAIGAPTEMWSQYDIQVQYGLVTKLDSSVREPSAEGPWYWNLSAGGTTDDTRWKKLAVEYLLTEKSNSLDASHFARHILKRYEESLQKLKKTDSFHPEPYEAIMREVNWLQEWAIVSKPFTEKKYMEYNDAVAKFYGGEMVCAGLLYSPVIGLLYPGDALKAYQEMYKLSIFDLGFARDLSSLATAMTAAAIGPKATKEDIVAVFRSIDPQGYFKSRLVGRRAYSLYNDARYMVTKAHQLSTEELNKITLPPQWMKQPDTLFYKRMMHTYNQLKDRNQDMPFHAAEIMIQLLTAMLFADFDFEKTLIFLANFGRDNDTNAAVVGGILGGFHGYKNLPMDMKTQVLKVNKEIAGIDLIALAEAVVQKMMKKS